MAMFDYDDDDDDFVAYQPVRTSSYSKYATRYNNPYLTSSSSSHRLRASSSSSSIKRLPTTTPAFTPAPPLTTTPSSSASSTTLLLILLLLPLIPLALWLLTPSLTPTPRIPPTLRKKRIILLIAHPDDEAMFFSPTLLALTSPELGNHLKILCMSTGNADGLGDTRRKELEVSALTLGVRRREDVFVMDDARFQDGMEEKWSEDEIAKVLAQAFAPAPSPPPPSSVQQQTSYTSSKSSKRKSLPPSAIPRTSTTPPPPQPEGPRATIDVLITFDALGISNHPNHIALHAGARRFLSNIMRGHAGWRCPVTLYTLPTVNLLRKYTFVCDALYTLISGVLSGGGGDEGEKALFVNDLGQYKRAREAMVKGHESQMVWFRWGWIGLGRYMVVNDLKRETVAGSAP